MKVLVEIPFDGKDSSSLEASLLCVFDLEAKSMSRLYELERRVSRLRESRQPLTDDLAKRLGNAHTRVTFLRRQRVRIEERMRQLEAEKT